MELKDKVTEIEAAITSMAMQLKDMQDRLDELELDASIAAERYQEMLKGDEEEDEEDEDRPPLVPFDTSEIMKLRQEMDEEEEADLELQANFNPYDLYDEVENVGFKNARPKPVRPDTATVDDLEQEGESDL